MKRNTYVIDKQNCEKKMFLMKLWNDYRLIHQMQHMETIIHKFNSCETRNSLLYFVQNYVFGLQEFMLIVCSDTKENI